MFGPHEAWLSIGALAFYVGDSMVLLYADQVLLERAGGRWWPRRGSSMLIAGRRPCLPNPLTPHRPLLQLSLERLLGDAGEAVDVQPFLPALLELRWLTLTLLGLFFLMPAVLYVTGTGAIFLGWMACAYAAVFTIAAVVWRRRDALGLTRLEAAKLGFEAIACAPFAINMVRRVTKRLKNPDLMGIRQLLDAESFQLLCETVDRMLEDRMQELTPDEPAAARLAIYRTRLHPGASP